MASNESSPPKVTPPEGEPTYSAVVSSSLSSTNETADLTSEERDLAPMDYVESGDDPSAALTDEQLLAKSDEESPTETAPFNPKKLDASKAFTAEDKAKILAGATASNTPEASKLPITPASHKYGKLQALHAARDKREQQQRLEKLAKKGEAGPPAPRHGGRPGHRQPPLHRQEEDRRVFFPLRAHSI